MKIIITGGAGFIGSHIAEYWNEKGAEVHVIDSLRSGFKKNIDKFENVIFHHESITNKSAVDEIMKGAKYVFNLAALVSVPESIEKPFECVDINVYGLLNILEAAKDNGVEKVVHSSSAAVYGDDPELPKRIDMRPNPKTPYSITKLDGEYYLKMYTEQFGLKTASLRYFNVYGTRQNPKSQYAAAIPIFVDKAVKNETITIFGDGEQTRDFINVKDVVRANVMAAESATALGVYNAANGDSITIKDLAEKIIKMTGSKSEIKFEPERPGDIKHSLASIDETVNELGFKPEINLDSGLMETVNYFRSLK